MEQISKFDHQKHLMVGAIGLLSIGGFMAFNRYNQNQLESLIVDGSTESPQSLSRLINDKNIRHPLVQLIKL
jgi:hypothetical protein